MSTMMSRAIEPLIRRKIFASEEDAVRSLVRDYVLDQLRSLQDEVSGFERKYGMRFEQFSAYLHERSKLLASSDYTEPERQMLGQAVMQEEDEWLEWKASLELLESWLDLRREIGA